MGTSLFVADPWLLIASSLGKEQRIKQALPWLLGTCLISLLWLHLILITSQGPCLLMLSHWGVGFQHVNFCGGVHKDTIYNNLPFSFYHPNLPTSSVLQNQNLFLMIIFLCIFYLWFWLYLNSLELSQEHLAIVFNSVPSSRTIRIWKVNITVKSCLNSYRETR